MAQTMKFEDKRVLKLVKIPRFSEICPGEMCYYANKTFYIIYDNKGNAHPNVAEIDGFLSNIRKKKMIKCYLSKDDTLKIVENIFFPNIENRESLAKLVLELSELHDTKNKTIQQVEIEYDKIEKIYENYKTIIFPSPALYKFCYYWVTLCIALDFREIEDKHTEDKRTVIGRSLIVKDAVDVIRSQMKRENFGKSWPRVLERVGNKIVKGITHVPVGPYDKVLRSDKFVNKKGDKISVEPCVKLSIDTESPKDLYEKKEDS